MGASSELFSCLVLVLVAAIAFLPAWPIMRVLPVPSTRPSFDAVFAGVFTLCFGVCSVAATWSLGYSPLVAPALVAWLAVVAGLWTSVVVHAIGQAYDARALESPPSQTPGSGWRWAALPWATIHVVAGVTLGVLAVAGSALHVGAAATAAPAQA